VGLKIYSDSLPLFPGRASSLNKDYARAGCHRNWDFYSPRVSVSPKVPSHIQDILFDPQTSGGLLISIAGDQAEVLLEKLTRPASRTRLLLAR